MRTWKMTCILGFCIASLTLRAIGQTEGVISLPPLDQSHPARLVASSGVVCIWNAVSIFCLFPGAQDWQKVPLPKEATQDVDPFGISRLGVSHLIIGNDQSLEFAAKQKIYRSSDRGSSWISSWPLPNGLRVTNVYDDMILPFRADSGRIWLAGFQLGHVVKDNQVAESAYDPGTGREKVPILGWLSPPDLRWNELKLPGIPGEIRELQVAGTTVLFSTNWDTYASRNSGESWAPVRTHSNDPDVLTPSDLPEKYREPGPAPHIFCHDATHCWVLDLDGTLLMTADMTHWQIASPKIFLDPLAFFDATNGLGLKAGRTGGQYLVKTKDAGKTWQAVVLNKEIVLDFSLSSSPSPIAYVLTRDALVIIRP